jgi:hypothetical protein
MATTSRPEKSERHTPRSRVLLVIFDLSNTAPGDPRYSQADDALKTHGQLFRPIKQLRLLVTTRPSRIVKASLDQRLGSNISLMISVLRDVAQIRIARIKIK